MYGFKALGKKIYLSVVMGLFLILNGNYRSCGGDKAAHSGLGSTKTKGKVSGFDHVSSSGLEKLVKNAIKKFGSVFVVWLHGMFEDNTRWEKVMPKIIQANPLRRVTDRIQPMFLKSRITKAQTALPSISKQADSVVEEIKEGITKRLEELLGTAYPHWTKQQKQKGVELGMPYIPIVLSGFSQGGLVAAMIGYNNTKKYGLNIKGIALVQTPLAGVSAFEPGMRDVSQFASKGSKGLNKLKMNAASSLAKMFGAKTGVNFSDFLNYFGTETAIQSMRYSSESIKQCCTFVRENMDSTCKAHNIPILLMAGCIEDLLSYLEYHSKHEEQIKAFVDELKEFIGGPVKGPHDGVVSLLHQLGRTEHCESLAAFSRTNCLQHILIGDWDYVMPNKPNNLKVYIAEKDVWHGRCGSKAIFARFDSFNAKESSTEMFDYESSKEMLSQWLCKRIDQWKEEA